MSTAIERCLGESRKQVLKLCCSVSKCNRTPVVFYMSDFRGFVNSEVNIMSKSKDYSAEKISRNSIVFQESGWFCGANP